MSFGGPPSVGKFHGKKNSPDLPSDKEHLLILHDQLMGRTPSQDRLMKSHDLKKGTSKEQTVIKKSVSQEHAKRANDKNTPKKIFIPKTNNPLPKPKPFPKNDPQKAINTRYRSDGKVVFDRYKFSTPDERVQETGQQGPEGTTGDERQKENRNIIWKSNESMLNKTSVVNKNDPSLRIVAKPKHVSAWDSSNLNAVDEKAVFNPRRNDNPDKTKMSSLTKRLYEKSLAKTHASTAMPNSLSGIPFQPFYTSDSASGRAISGSVNDNSISVTTSRMASPIENNHILGSSGGSSHTPDRRVKSGLLGEGLGKISMLSSPNEHELLKEPSELEIRNRRLEARCKLLEDELNRVNEARQRELRGDLRLRNTLDDKTKGITVPTTRDENPTTVLDEAIMGRKMMSETMSLSTQYDLSDHLKTIQNLRQQLLEREVSYYQVDLEKDLEKNKTLHSRSEIAQLKIDLHTEICRSHGLELEKRELEQEILEKEALIAYFYQAKKEWEFEMSQKKIIEKVNISLKEKIVFLTNLLLRSKQAGDDGPLSEDKEGGRIFLDATKGVKYYPGGDAATNGAKFPSEDEGLHISDEDEFEVSVVQEEQQIRSKLRTKLRTQSRGEKESVSVSPDKTDVLMKGCIDGDISEASDLRKLSKGIQSEILSEIDVPDEISATEEKLQSEQPRENAAQNKKISNWDRYLQGLGEDIEDNFIQMSTEDRQQFIKSEPIPSLHESRRESNIPSQFESPVLGPENPPEVPDSASLIDPGKGINVKSPSIRRRRDTQDSDESAFLEDNLQVIESDTPTSDRKQALKDSVNSIGGDAWDHQIHGTKSDSADSGILERKASLRLDAMVDVDNMRSRLELPTSQPKTTKTSSKEFPSRRGSKESMISDLVDEMIIPSTSEMESD